MQQVPVYWLKDGVHGVDWKAVVGDKVIFETKTRDDDAVILSAADYQTWLDGFATAFIDLAIQIGDGVDAANAARAALVVTAKAKLQAAQALTADEANAVVPA